MADSNTYRKRVRRIRNSRVDGMPRGLVAPPDTHVLEVIESYEAGVVEDSQPRGVVLALLEQGFIRRQKRTGKRGSYTLLITEMGRAYLRRQRAARGVAV